MSQNITNRPNKQTGPAIVNKNTKTHTKKKRKPTENIVNSAKVTQTQQQHVSTLNRFNKKITETKMHQSFDTSQLQ